MNRESTLQRYKISSERMKFYLRNKEKSQMGSPKFQLGNHSTEQIRGLLEWKNSSTKKPIMRNTHHRFWLRAKRKLRTPTDAVHILSLLSV
ncbi:hypothetical protein HPP92_013695 [Vanilla planifolia]|uniref:Uncharacterized protein n=1 Tax=Vanilla planifolia TaxID=51239 RepID=A0A835V0V4_VANPL|nr:hypothetical protein HPP92_013695 [Vanilla planifolia]